MKATTYTLTHVTPGATLAVTVIDGIVDAAVTAERIVKHPEHWLLEGTRLDVMLASMREMFGVAE